jgi:hypothetical protein
MQPAPIISCAFSTAEMAVLVAALYNQPNIDSPPPDLNLGTPTPQKRKLLGSPSEARAFQIFF